MSQTASPFPQWARHISSSVSKSIFSKMNTLSAHCEDKNSSNSSSTSSSTNSSTPISCYDVFEKFCACSVSTKQFDHLRREGTFQNCNELLSDVSICLQSKVIRDPIKQQEKYNEMKVLKQVLHINNTWEYKKNPSWLPDEE